MAHNVLDIAKWFLTKEAMTHKKLQKLCYYSQAWYATLHEGERLIDGEFEAWIHGPVNRALYNVYSGHGWNLIPLCEEEPGFLKKEVDFLQVLYDCFGKFDGDQLEAMSHAEQPWKDARKGYAQDEPCNEVIPLEKMIEYYTKLSKERQME